MSGYIFQIIDWLSSFVANPKHGQVIILGMQESGKTTILFKLKQGVDAEVPAHSYYPESLNYKNLYFTLWEAHCPGNMGWVRTYLENSHAIIYAVDSTEPEKMTEAREWLHRFLADEDLYKKTPLIVFANKQDLPSTMGTDEITTRLGLHALTDRVWSVQPTCAVKCEGLKEGLDWIIGVVNDSSDAFR